MPKVRIKNFAKSKIHLPLPYLLTLQRESWRNFWDTELKELFQEISPIRDYTKKEFELWILDFTLL